MKSDRDNSSSRIGTIPLAAPLRLRIQCGWVILLAAFGIVFALEAQDANAPALTNLVTQSEDLTGADASQPADALSDDETPGTNAVAITNQTASPDPDARARRLGRQRRTRSPGNGQAYGSGQSDTTNTNTGPGALDYSAFRLVIDRNIFDPNRSPRSTSTPRRPKTVESFTLVGIMSYEKGVFAFFDGTGSDYKKVLKREGAIAGYKLVAISPESVKLMLNTNIVELSVGAQMRRRDDGIWERSASPAAYAETSSTASPSDAASSGAESDIIKKMMQRREKE